MAGFSAIISAGASAFALCMGLCPTDPGWSGHDFSVAAVEAAPPTMSEWDVLQEINPEVIARLAQWETPNGVGALGRNKPAYFSVRWQEPMTRSIVKGLLDRDPSRIDMGIRAMEYAFTYQNLDGSFPIVVPPQFPGTKAYPQDYADAVSFLFSELGRSMLLLDDNAWFQTAAETAALRPRVAALRPAIELALDWLLTQQGLMMLADWDLPNHLAYNADGLYFVGQLLDRADAIDAGHAFVDPVLANQWGNGVLPENGGYDSSYQSVTLYRLLLLFLRVDPADGEFRQALWTAIDRGIAWELTRILPTGEVDTTGNSRVHPGGDKILGVEKNVAYVNTVMALTFYGILARRPSIVTTANRVATYYTTRR